MIVFLRYMHGLMGMLVSRYTTIITVYVKCLSDQFMVKGMAIDPMRKMLTYPDNHDPVYSS